METKQLAFQSIWKVCSAIDQHLQVASLEDNSFLSRFIQEAYTSFANNSLFQTYTKDIVTQYFLRSWKAQNAIAVKLRNLKAQLEKLPPYSHDSKIDQILSKISEFLHESDTVSTDGHVQNFSKLVTEVEKEIVERFRNFLENEVHQLIPKVDADGTYKSWVRNLSTVNVNRLSFAEIQTNPDSHLASSSNLEEEELNLLKNHHKVIEKHLYHSFENIIQQNYKIYFEVTKPNITQRFREHFDFCFADMSDVESEMVSFGDIVNNLLSGIAENSVTEAEDLISEDSLTILFQKLNSLNEKLSTFFSKMINEYFFLDSGQAENLRNSFNGKEVNKSNLLSLYLIAIRFEKLLEIEEQVLKERFIDYDSSFRPYLQWSLLPFREGHGPLPEPSKHSQSEKVQGEAKSQGFQLFGLESVYRRSPFQGFLASNSLFYRHIHGALSQSKSHDQFHDFDERGDSFLDDSKGILLQTLENEAKRYLYTCSEIVQDENYSSLTDFLSSKTPESKISSTSTRFSQFLPNGLRGHLSKMNSLLSLRRNGASEKLDSQKEKKFEFLYDTILSYYLQLINPSLAFNFLHFSFSNHALNLSHKLTLQRLHIMEQIQLITAKKRNFMIYFMHLYNNLSISESLDWKEFDHYFHDVKKSATISIKYPSMKEYFNFLFTFLCNEIQKLEELEKENYFHYHELIKRSESTRLKLLSAAPLDSFSKPLINSVYFEVDELLLKVYLRNKQVMKEKGIVIDSVNEKLWNENLDRWILGLEIDDLRSRIRLLDQKSLTSSSVKSSRGSSRVESLELKETFAVLAEKELAWEKVAIDLGYDTTDKRELLKVQDYSVILRWKAFCDRFNYERFDVQCTKSHSKRFANDQHSITKPNQQNFRKYLYDLQKIFENIEDASFAQSHYIDEGVNRYLLSIKQKSLVEAGQQDLQNGFSVPAYQAESQKKRNPSAELNRTSLSNQSMNLSSQFHTELDLTLVNHHDFFSNLYTLDGNEMSFVDLEYQIRILYEEEKLKEVQNKLSVLIASDSSNISSTAAENTSSKGHDLSLKEEGELKDIYKQLESVVECDSLGYRLYQLERKRLHQLEVLWTAIFFEKFPDKFIAAQNIKYLHDKQFMKDLYHLQKVFFQHIKENQAENEKIKQQKSSFVNQIFGSSSVSCLSILSDIENENKELFENVFKILEKSFHQVEAILKEEGMAISVVDYLEQKDSEKLKEILRNYKNIKEAEFFRKKFYHFYEYYDGEIILNYHDELHGDAFQQMTITVPCGSSTQISPKNTSGSFDGKSKMFLPFSISAKYTLDKYLHNLPVLLNHLLLSTPLEDNFDEYFRNFCFLEEYHDDSLHNPQFTNPTKNGSMSRKSKSEKSSKARETLKVTFENSDDDSIQMLVVNLSKLSLDIKDAKEIRKRIFYLDPLSSNSDKKGVLHSFFSSKPDGSPEVSFNYLLSLDLSYNYIDKTFLEIFFRAINISQKKSIPLLYNLSILNLNHNSLHDEGMIFLCECLQPEEEQVNNTEMKFRHLSLRNLHTLLVQWNNITSASCGEISKMLAVNTTLYKLDLSYNHLCDDGIIKFVDMFLNPIESTLNEHWQKKRSSLSQNSSSNDLPTSVKMHDSTRSDKSGVFSLKQLKGHKFLHYSESNLHELALQWNNISDLGAFALSLLFSQYVIHNDFNNPSSPLGSDNESSNIIMHPTTYRNRLNKLTILDLHWNHIHNDGAIALISSILFGNPNHLLISSLTKEYKDYTLKMSQLAEDSSQKITVSSKVKSASEILKPARDRSDTTDSYDEEEESKAVYVPPDPALYEAKLDSAIEEEFISTDEPSEKQPLNPQSVKDTIPRESAESIGNTFDIIFSQLVHYNCLHTLKLSKNCVNRCGLLVIYDLLLEAQSLQIHAEDTYVFDTTKRYSLRKHKNKKANRRLSVRNSLLEIDSLHDKNFKQNSHSLMEEESLLSASSLHTLDFRENHFITLHNTEENKQISLSYIKNLFDQLVIDVLIEK